jgi:hypothetical protein
MGSSGARRHATAQMCADVGEPLMSMIRAVWVDETLDIFGSNLI